MKENRGLAIVFATMSAILFGTWQGDFLAGLAAMHFCMLLAILPTIK